jgi:cytoskeletal protein CcmA (bactofilin family)
MTEKIGLNYEKNRSRYPNVRTAVGYGRKPCIRRYIVFEWSCKRRHATIKGEIKGTVRATERLELFPPARVYGDINAPVIQIDAGVIFEGTCTIQPKENSTSKTERVLSTKRRENTKTDETISEATAAIPLRQKQQT